MEYEGFQGFPTIPAQSDDGHRMEQEAEQFLVGKIAERLAVL
jgi:hypothetical protein